MPFDESTNFHEAIAPGQEIGKAERQLDAAIGAIIGGEINAGGLGVLYISTSSGVVQATTDEVTILGSDGVGTLTIAANGFSVGTVLRVTARGYYSSLDGGDNLNIRMYLGATVLVSTGNFLPSMGANKYWEISGFITCRSVGAEGELMPSAHMSLFDGDGVGMIRTTLAEVDTTADLTFDLTAEWDTSDLDNAVFCTSLLLEKLQVGNANLSPTDVTVEFSEIGSISDQNALTHDVEVLLQMPDGANAAEAITVNWSATNVSGTSTGTVTFPPGSITGATQNITLTLDYSLGNPVVTLSDPSANATLGTVDTHDVIIVWQRILAFNTPSGSDPFTTYGDCGFTVFNGRGSYSSGNGWVADTDTINVSFQIDMYRSFGTIIVMTGLEMTYYRTNGENVGSSFTGEAHYGGGWAWVAGGESSPYDDVIKTTSNAVVTPPSTASIATAASFYDVGGIRFRAMSAYEDPGPPSPSGAAGITQGIMRGQGVDPFA